LNYYDTNVAAFIERTSRVNVEHLRGPFVARLPTGGRVLDAGSGSGRDSRAFKAAGFDVTAIDASIAMVEATRSYATVPVQHCTFLQFTASVPFDGIWACASLLHVPRNELARTVQHLLGLLTSTGVLYASFKRGSTDRTDGERYFNDLTPQSLADTVMSIPNARLDHVWETSGVQDPTQRWVNGFIVPR